MCPSIIKCPIRHHVSWWNPHLAWVFFIPNLIGGWATPLKNMSSLGLWHSQLNGKIQFMFQTTNQQKNWLPPRNHGEKEGWNHVFETMDVWNEPGMGSYTCSWLTGFPGFSCDNPEYCNCLVNPMCLKIIIPQLDGISLALCGLKTTDRH